MSERAVVGKTVQFREGNRVPYGQDFGFHIGVPDGVSFTIETGSRFQEGGTWRLVADGYGAMDKPNSYGNGALYVRATDVKDDDLVVQDEEAPSRAIVAISEDRQWLVVQADAFSDGGAWFIYRDTGDDNIRPWAIEAWHEDTGQDAHDVLREWLEERET